MPETIHIIRQFRPTTYCGLNWAINMIGCAERQNLDRYRDQPDKYRICPKCEEATR